MNIQEGVSQWKAAPGALLIDLRDKEDFKEGHIPGAKNILLKNLRGEMEAIAEFDTPIFLYCYRGMRSWQAEAVLQGAGYKNAVSIGGISKYKGELE